MKLLLTYNTISFSDMYLLTYIIKKLEKTEELIKTMDNPETIGNIGHTKHRTKTSKTKSQHRKIKWWATRTPPSYRGRILVLVKGRRVPVSKQTGCSPGCLILTSMLIPLRLLGILQIFCLYPNMLIFIHQTSIIYLRDRL